MFGFGKKKSFENENSEAAKYRKDNETLLARISTLESKVKYAETKADGYLKDFDNKKKELKRALDEVDELEAKIKDLESSKSVRVKYAEARKTMSKAKLKQMREALEAVPGNAAGFSGSVSVYDKKSKKLSLVALKSKAEALEIVSKAEKGNVDIII